MKSRIDLRQKEKTEFIKSESITVEELMEFLIEGAEVMSYRDFCIIIR